MLAGEGIALFSITEDRVRVTIAAGRDSPAERVDLYIDDSGFTTRARGAAAVAIRAAVDRLHLD